jgi:tetratricopeptide (TPR) repeat protein
MLLSPRNLARGYRWTDALSHEYIHYLLVHLSANRAPIWLHEGIAKYFEDIWRLPDSAWLSRRTESLLAHALANDSFVGFKNMEPSLVKLETTYQVQLGYAEAASAIDFIIHSLGAAGLVGILKELQQSEDDGATGAIARVMDRDFAQFEQNWRQFLESKQLREHAGIRLPRYQLKEDGKMPATDLQQEIESSTARMHMRLGDRIRQRGRERAAVAEYRRALDKDPYSPYLLNKLAGTLISQGQFEPALQHLERARVLEPDYVTTYTHLGRLHVAQQNFAQARLALEEAIQLNPFDPSIHQYLADIYRRLDLQDKARQEQDVLKRLQETP